MEHLQRMAQTITTRLGRLYNNFDVVVFCLLAFILLVPKFQLISVGGTYVNIRIEDFLVGIVYLLWLIAIIARRFSLQSVFHIRALLLFLIYGAFITFMGIFAFDTVENPNLGLLHWLRRVEYFGMYFIAASVLKPERIEKYCYGLLGVGVTTWIYGIFQYNDILPGVHTLSQSGNLGTYSEIGYLISTFAAHYDFGAFLILMVMLSVWGYFSHDAWSKKIGFIVLALAFWWMSRIVYGRAAYLGMLVGLIFVFGVKFSGWILLPIYEVFKTFDRYFGGKFSRYSYDLEFSWTKPKPLPTGAPPSPTPTPEFVSNLTPRIGEELIPNPTSRFPNAQRSISKEGATSFLDNMVNSLSVKLKSLTGSFDLKLDPSANIRLQEWQDAIAKVGYHYWWGGGYYTAGLGTDNDYLRALVEVGVIGLAVFLLILFDFFKIAWQLFRHVVDSKEKHFYLAFMGFLIGLMVEAIFIDIFEASKIAFLFWFTCGMVSVGFAHYSYETVKEPE